MRIPSERGQTKASTRNCERKPTTRRATGARKSGRKVVTVDPMHTKAQTCNSNQIRGPCSSSGRGPVRFRRLLNLRNRPHSHCRPRPRRFAAQLLTCPQLLYRRYVLHFVDNSGALYASLKCCSGVPEMARIVHFWRLTVLSLQAVPWLDYVPSESPQRRVVVAFPFLGT